MTQDPSGAEPDGASSATHASAGDSPLLALAIGAFRLARRAPRAAFDLAQQTARGAERLALSTLRRRMDVVLGQDSALAPRATDTPGEYLPRPVPGTSVTGAAPVTAAAAMARLLELSLEQTPESAREALSLRTVLRLVPDEARILAALADGHSAALMHVGAGSLIGPTTQRWLENLSPVGKEAGVQLPDQTPHYLASLRDLGLVESGDEDKALHLKYQLLEAETRVRHICEQIEKRGLRPKFFRRTIRISEAGRAFWTACEAIENKSW